MYMYTRLWNSSVNSKFKMNVFKAVVLSVLFSAMVVFVLSKGEYRKMSCCYYKLLRKMLGSEACKKIKDEKGVVVKHESLANNAVCKKLRICSFTTEFRIRRRVFFQSMLRHIESHELYLSTLFGQYYFESARPSAHENPWIAQYYLDIKACNVLDDMLVVCENVSESLIELIKDPELREAFVNCDVSALRSHELSYIIGTSNNGVDNIEKTH